MALHIACIVAHPDDAEYHIGGTLALLRQLGHEVAIITMTPGDCGSKTHAPDEIAAIRRREAAAAAAVIGARYHCLEFRDMAVFVDDPSRRRVTALLRELQPNVVLTGPPVDYHCDHEATSLLVRDACFSAPAPNYQAGDHPPLTAIPHLYYMDPSGGVDRDDQMVRPDWVVDVTSVMDAKRAMLSRHDSQCQWLKDHHGVDDFLGLMEEFSRVRGKLAGVEFGEGLRRYRGSPYPQTPALERLLPVKPVTLTE